ncbi:hypothetical protein, partial [Escherichia coli]|uniref:hypothetical protein n=1 Tax=Escherichia coli TaxID=562 RepID=UPI003F467796
MLDEIPVVSEEDYMGLNVTKIDEEVNKIPMLRDFPQLFPDDLPSILPIWEMEFEIKLQPGATPISIPLYRMAITEMNE